MARLKTLFRCQNCSYGPAHCLYSKFDLEIENGYTRISIPENNCLMGKSDEYAIWPDGEEKDGLMIWRVCERIDEYDIDPIGSSPYLWESENMHQTKGELFDIGNRYDYDNPGFIMVDYNAPLNMTGRVRLDERCDIVGKNNLFLSSRGWVEDVHGDPKRPMGIERVKQCYGVYGVYDKNLGIMMHKSMKDWTNAIPSFKNYLFDKPEGYVRTMNIFETDIEIVEEFLTSVIEDENACVRVIEGVDALINGERLSLYELMKNNNISDDNIRLINRKLSTKNPRDIYYSKDNKYNVEKICNIYFNIKFDKLKVPHMFKRRLMGNIVNYILNDKELFNTSVYGDHHKKDYAEWYKENGINFDDDELDMLHPENIGVTNYIKPGQRSWFTNAVIADAMHKELLIKTVVVGKSTIDDYPEHYIKYFRKHHKYQENYIEPIHPTDMAAPHISITELLEIDEDNNNMYKVFKNMCVVMYTITPKELKATWQQFKSSYALNRPDLFWSWIYGIVQGNNPKDINSMHTKENPYSFAQFLWNCCIDEDSFEIYTPPEGELPYWDVNKFPVDIENLEYDINTEEEALYGC